MVHHVQTVKKLRIFNAGFIVNWRALEDLEGETPQSKPLTMSDLLHSWRDFNTLKLSNFVVPVLKNEVVVLVEILEGVVVVCNFHKKILWTGSMI